MSYQDLTLSCADCGAEFVFTAGEQEFHASKGFTTKPRRCPKCRQARKAAQNGGAPQNSGNDSSFTPRPPRQMYDAVCAECGKQTQVPFQPNGTRPVYCSDCFKASNPQGARSFNNNRGPRTFNNDRPARQNNSFDYDSSGFSSSENSKLVSDLKSIYGSSDAYPPPPSGGRKRRGGDKRNNRGGHGGRGGYDDWED